MAPRNALQTQTALKKGRERRKRTPARCASVADSTWVYFTVEAMIYSQGVDIFVPDMDMVQHATPLDAAFPVRLEYAQGIYMAEASHDVTVVLPFEIQFRMLQADANGITDARIKRKLQAEFERLLPKLRRLQNRDVPIHTEILRHAKAVRITAIARSAKPDRDYAEMFS